MATLCAAHPLYARGCFGLIIYSSFPRTPSANPSLPWGFRQPLPVADGEGRDNQLMFVKLLADDSAVVWCYTHIIAGCSLIVRHGINF